MTRRSIRDVYEAWRGRRAAARIVDVARQQDHDEGFGAGMLDLMSGVGLRSTEADVVRTFDQFSATMRQLRARLTDLPELYPQDEQTTTYNELRYWGEIADSITSQLDACTPGVRSTIAAQLVDDRAWLIATREHYAWCPPED
ncbi:hypothetical protein [Curtobacterium sp. ME26]|uniref:hypothetical protein n=1 Tax=Curtobacterium sp. ME26 TaxID=2744254 RepID=UPI0015F411D7|nr:hypothetical protein [Curtobacterium sp. ME26]